MGIELYSFNHELTVTNQFIWSELINGLGQHLTDAGS